MNSKVLNMRVSPELYQRIESLAEEKNISVAALIRMVLAEYAKRSEAND